MVLSSTFWSLSTYNVPLWTLTRERFGRHCKLTLSILGEHKLGSANVSAAGVCCCCFLSLCELLPLPHLPRQKPINRLEREYIYQSGPSIINQCRVKSDQRSWIRSKHGLERGGWGGVSPGVSTVQSLFSPNLSRTEKKRLSSLLLRGLYGYKACNYT